MNILYCKGCGNQLSNKFIKFNMSRNKKVKILYDNMDIINMCCKNTLMSSRQDKNYRDMISKIRK